MPAEYERQRDAMIVEGKSPAEAKKFAAINFFKKHGASVQAAHKRAGARIKLREKARRKKR